MSRTNTDTMETEKVETVSEPVVETVKETVSEEVVEKPVVEKKVVTKNPVEPVAAMTAETQKMNAKQFFDTYPHDNEQVVNLIITLYGKQIKTVAQWEAFYQQMLKKKVS